MWTNIHNRPLGYNLRQYKHHTLCRIAHLVVSFEDINKGVDGFGPEAVPGTECNADPSVPGDIFPFWVLSRCSRPVRCGSRAKTAWSRFIDQNISCFAFQCCFSICSSHSSMEVGRRETVVVPCRQFCCRRPQAALHSLYATFDIDEAQQHRLHDKALNSIEFDHGSRFEEQQLKFKRIRCGRYHNVIGNLSVRHSPLHMGDDGGTRKIRPCSAEVESSWGLDPLTCPAKQDLSKAVTVAISNWRVEVKSKSYLYRYVLCLITYPNPIPLFIEAQPRPEGPPLQSQSLLVCHARFVRRVSYSARFQKQSATSIKMTRRCCEIEAFRLRNGFPSSSVLLLRSPRLQCRPA